MQPIAPGDVLDEKYEIVRELGSGAMGVVFVANHLTLAKKVAVKTLHAEIAANVQLLQRFEQEARAASAIGHPNIIEVYDLGTAPNGARYMVMEHLDGESLADLLEHVPLLTPDRAGNLMAQVLSALNAAHRAGIVHRDLKPDNIFITRNDDNPEFVKLLDFGISKVLEAADPSISGVKAGGGGAGATGGGSGRQTRFGDLLGTPLYMSPEQARGETNLDHRTDLWACGTVLYEMLCGSTPFSGENYQQILAAILEGQFKPPRLIRPAMPPALEAVILRAMSWEKVQRYPNAADMRRELIQALVSSAPRRAPVAPARPSLPDLDLGDVTPAPTLKTGREQAAEADPDADAGSSNQMTSALDVANASGGVNAELADALSRLGSGEISLGVGARGPAAKAPPAAAPAVAAATPSAALDDPTTAAATGPAAQPIESSDLFAPPEAATALQLTVNIADRGTDSGSRTVADDMPVARAAGGTDRRGGSSARAARPRFSIGVVITSVIFLLIIGVGGFAGYRYYKEGYILEKPQKKTTSVRFVVIPSDAEILVDGEPLTERPFMVDIKKPYRFEFKSPGRMRAVRVVNAQPGETPALSLRLPHLIAPLSWGVAYAAVGAAPAAQEPATLAEYKEVDAALSKLRLYTKCLGKMAESLGNSQDTYRASTRKGRIKKSRLPTVIPIPPDVVDLCRTLLATARDREPAIPNLDKRVVAFLDELNKLVPVLKRLATYYAEKQYTNDGLKLGKRKHGEVTKRLASTMEAQRKLFSLTLATRLHWQTRELKTIAAREGLGAHWHLRRLIVASQTWVAALLRGVSPTRRAELAAALGIAHKSAVELGKKNPEAMKTLTGGAAFLEAAGAVAALSAAKKGSPSRRTALQLHNKAVALFNKMTL